MKDKISFGDLIRLANDLDPDQVATGDSYFAVVIANLEMDNVPMTDAVRNLGRVMGVLTE